MLRIKGGWVIDPASRFDRTANVLIDAGLIVAVTPPDTMYAENADEIDATGMMVCPGFVDLHTHLRYPGFPHKETMESGTAAAAAGGFTTLCAMANTNPVVDSVEVLHAVEAEAEHYAAVRVRQLAAVSQGLQGQRLSNLETLGAAGAVAFSDDGKPVWNVDVMQQALRASARLGLAVSVHEEDPTIVGAGVANAGDRARRLGLSEWPCRGEACMVERDVAILKKTGGHLHVAHVSCAETVEHLRAARALGLHVTAEVTPHHLRLTDQLLEGEPRWNLPPGHSCTKVNPPLRSPHDVDAVVAALSDGTIDAVATDHAPHHQRDKDGSYDDAAFGISSLETALPLLLDLVRAGNLPLMTALARLTSGPAGVFNLSAGRLAEGEPADITIFDPDVRWLVVPDALRSQGKNTPLLGSEMQGRVVHTLVAGEIVYSAAR